MNAVLSEERSAQQPPLRPSARPAISVTNVSKSFRLPHQQYHTFKERALHPFRARSFDVLRAVRDVSFEIPHGEFFGIVGRNGSGKSTLLKCLAGIYDIDGGDLSIDGRLSPFIELGVGFNPDLAARDNVIINAIMLGLSRKQARERFDEILAFAELEQFIDLKLKNYSSGMYVRLAFATAVQVDAEILLIDEVLAVGDAAFQQKCFDAFTRLQREGRTIVFVTHDMGAVQRFCDRAMLLDAGRVVEIGEPGSVARRYNQLNFDRQVTSATTGGESAASHAQAEILNAWFESSKGEVVVTARQGELLDARMDVRFIVETENPIFAIALQNEQGHAAFKSSSDLEPITTGRFAAGSTASIRLRFDNWLAPGRYRLIATVARDGLGADVFDTHMEVSIIVMADRPGGGFADLPHRFEVERDR